MTDNPYLQWPVFRRSVVAAFGRSLTAAEEAHHGVPPFHLGAEVVQLRIQAGIAQHALACGGQHGSTNMAQAEFSVHLGGGL
jgi:hypothetical protein